MCEIHLVNAFQDEERTVLACKTPSLPLLAPQNPLVVVWVSVKELKLSYQCHQKKDIVVNNSVC